MSKVIEQVKKTTVEYTKKAIEGTNFVKWYAKCIENINEVNTVKNNCGICDIETFEKHNSIELISNKVYVEEFYNKQGVFAVIKKSELEKVMSCEKHISEVIDYLTIDNIDDPDYEIVIWGVGAHQLMNLNMEFMPIPIHFDYINGSLSNEYYNLDEAIVKIKNSPYTLRKSEVEIKRIPYYNCTETSYAQVAFFTLLPLDLYKKYEELHIRKSRYAANDFILHEVYGLEYISNY